MHGDRNGFLYNIDRTNGKFVYGKEISKVNWATGFTPEGRPIVNPEKVPSYTYEAKDICPASEGGKWWNPMSYSPAKQMVFVPSREICTDIKSAKGDRTEGKPHLGHRQHQVEQGTWPTGRVRRQERQQEMDRGCTVAIHERRADHRRRPGIRRHA